MNRLVSEHFQSYGSLKRFHQRNAMGFDENQEHSMELNVFYKRIAISAVQPGWAFSVIPKRLDFRNSSCALEKKLSFRELSLFRYRSAS